jgi:hypothetical protein
VASPSSVAPAEEAIVDKELYLALYGTRSKAMTFTGFFTQAGF